MKKKRYTQPIRVKSPCTQDWNEMSGNDQVRFCSHCAKDVNDLSSMTRREAMHLVRASNGQLCIRYIKHPETGAPVFAEQLIQISRRVPRVAAGVMSASLSLSTFAYAQGGAAVRRTEPAAAERQIESRAIQPLNDPQADTKNTDTNGETETHGSIWGTIFDKAGAVLPGATVTLADKDGKEITRAVTGYDGTYRLEHVPFERYQFVAAAVGFRRQMSYIRLDAATKRIGDIKLDVQQMVLGMVAVSTSKTTETAKTGPLMSAVEDDEIDEARALIAAGEDVNRAEDDDATPVFAAIENGNLEMVRLLLDFGAKLNVHDDEKLTPLMMLDEDASLELVELLLRSGAKVNRVAENGDTALIRAARSAQPEVLRALIDAGAELNVQNDEGVTALMSAADNEILENVRLLVLAGADVNLRDNEGDNAWDYTSTKEIEEFLVGHGVVVDPEDYEEASEEVTQGNFQLEEPSN